MAAAKKSKTKIKRRAQSIASSKQQNEKKKMKHTFRKQHFSSLSNGCLLLVLGATLLFGACADDDLANEQPGKHTGTTVAFNVSDAQMEALVQAGAKGITRGLSPQPLSSADLAPRKLEATGSNPHDFCLIESTVEGINPVKPAEGTRAEIIKTATLGDFSSIGYRAASSAAAANPSTALLWFHGEKTNPDGTLQSRYDWDWPVNVYGRFYAVYPEATPANKITLSPSNYAQVPYVDFEVNQDVKQQKDLMTACSGEVHYIHGNDPTSNLKFHHALAAVKFSIGSNLSPVTITKIELTNVKYKGRYRLSNQADGSGATWTSDNATTTMTLDNINMNAAEMPNTMLAGALDPDPNHHNRTGRENYTFLMIPQTMPAKTAANAIKAVIYYQDGATTKTITIPLTGEWKAGMTKEYKLSQKNSSWSFQLTLFDNSKTFDYQGNALGSAQFYVKSLRQGGATQQAVPWKISKYEEWDYTLHGGTGGWVDKGETKPAWLGDLTDHGSGGTAAEEGNTAVKPATVTDKLAAYNKVLKDATPKGTAANPYNLANPGGSGAKSHIEETANCYLISAPGHYCIPLVYGNAIKNGTTNSHAYQTSNSGPYILQHFKDHVNVDISSPYINVQNTSDPAMQASIVWTDQSGLVDGLTVTGSGANSYVNFHVPADKIKNGNAVIAVKNASGTVMWSWHLWFDHSDVLNTIACTNYQGNVYNFTKQTLGFAYRKWEESTYSKPRKARMKVEQTIANGGTKLFAYIDITQYPNIIKQISSTLYQFGRKDAFPGTDATADGSFNKDGGDNMSIQNGIRHPETLYTSGSSWYNSPPTGYSYYNLWSMNNTATGFNDDAVVKTIYDPCPAGFHMPASNAFTGFTTTGNNSSTPSEWNVSGDWDYGYNFNNKISSPDATVYFPGSGYRYHGGLLCDVGTYCYCWSAVPDNTYYGCYLSSSIFGVRPHYDYGYRSYGYSVRPVAEP